MGTFRFVLCALAALMFAAPGIDVASAQTEKRVALVIGNAAYQNTPALSNPVNDGEDLAAALKQVGFTVILERNLTKREMEAAIARFARLAQNVDAAMFFYAGHGMQWRGTNYLVPVDAKLEDEFNLNFELTRLDEVLFGLERARGVKILVLDACRNSPLLDRLNRTSSTRDLITTRGFAKIESTRGMVIAYSTQINQVAVDGTGRNSPFTQALVKEIDEPGVEISTMFRRVAAQVNKVTDGRQLPELSVSLLGEFYLNTRETDLQAWSKIRTSDGPAQLRDFIARYPASDLLAHAQQSLDSMERSERTRIEQERAERDRLERVAREQAGRAKTERERFEQERIIREQAAQRERVERERLEGERIARDQAEREKTAAQVQTAVLTQPPERVAAAPAALSGSTLALQIKKELHRVGCYTGRMDDKWTTADTKEAVKNFAKFAKLQSEPNEPVVGLLDAIKSRSGRVCPLECRSREIEKNGRCVRRNEQVKASLGVPERKEPTRQSAVARADQARTAGTYYECMGARSGCLERALNNTDRFPTPAAARAWCSRRPTC